MKTLYLVRHGETRWNEAGRLQGSEVDEPLSQGGEAQADLAGRLLKGLDPDVTMASPLRRAVETGRRCGFSNPEIDQRWTENALGDWSGQDVADLVRLDEAAYLAWRRGRLTPPGGESFESVQARVRSVVDDLEDGALALVFTHGGTIRAAAAALVGLDPAHLSAALPGSITVIQVGETGGSLAKWNLTATPT